ncbi:hypothetical protein EYF80_046359 [Liparis tanakae]|uniref:Uncharacterized protein n=1 Tax=Liparis tanakae TaxID=230148 RepID=A0A4Z2FRE8_9TELE|nr:hypothetical protein EYF80_046359 [Liparis tanakae]
MRVLSFMVAVRAKPLVAGDDMRHVPRCRVTRLSAALKMPLVACARSSAGQEERKRSSSFIIERMLEADTSARESSNARLEGREERINVAGAAHKLDAGPLKKGEKKTQVCCDRQPGAISLSESKFRPLLLCRRNREAGVFSTHRTRWCSPSASIDAQSRKTQNPALPTCSRATH